MCTLTIAWRVFEDAPVAVAANRDEALERDSLPPDIYRDDPLVVAPQDAEAGGTWIGYNEFGVFAGITNRWIDADLAGERSRGLLVADVLEAGSAAEAASIVEEATAADEYAGFNLVIADATDAVCFRWDGDLERTAFEPGVHVVVNAAVDDDADVPDGRADAARAQARNARSVRRALSTGPDESVTDWLERAGAVLGDHDYGVCLHRDGFGTRSSSLLAIGSTTRYWFAPGPPCRTAYEPVELGDGTEASRDAGIDLEGHI
ncbi:NRDE family protein [Halopiger djelfimassiliensis]|uniref:NRDE family protein n=1 Tax=Halopiger djelfimassiliensis TaxID=1293047 RepID=UPI000678221B|nr:NRDE family protein [Halopiger djelfimassiliensis]